MVSFVESYVQQQGLWETRVQKGHQPSLPYTSVQFLICANIFYLGFTWVLYRYMKSRPSKLDCKPFKSILLTYNFSCVLLAGYVVYGLGAAMLSGRLAFVCNKTIIPDGGQGSDEDAMAHWVAHVFWVFYAQKFWEFLDTWFFIMRQSWRQVTFLHVFHHCSINIVVGLILPFEFNGDMYLPIFLNALVHVLMYTHYLVSALGMSTPWKPYLTSMQLSQFVLIATQSSISLSRGDTCGAPYFGKVLMVAYMASMLILFGHFFYNSYVLKKPSSGGGVVKKPEPIQVSKTFTGRVELDESGCAKIPLPAKFSSGEVQYQITPIGAPMPTLYVSQEPQADDCSFSLTGGVPHKKVSWTVSMVTTLLGKEEKQSTGIPCCRNETVDNVQDGARYPDKKGQ